MANAADALHAGDKDHAAIEQKAAQALASHGWQVEYVSIRAQAGLGKPQPGERALVILAAARLGAPRLIDNIEVCL